MTTLDDLFARDSDRRRRGGLGRWLLRATLLSLVLAAAAAAVLYAVGLQLWYPLLPLAVFAGLLLHRVVTGLDSYQPAATGPWRKLPERAELNGLVPAVHRWHARVRLDRTGATRSRRGLRPRLAELVDERLRQRRGITRASHPEQARALLGERLSRYLDDPDARHPSPRQLAAMLTIVEEL